MLAVRQPQGGALAEAESSRAIQEVQAAMVIAKRFPRDEGAALSRILASCERPSLAEQAIYTFPRGGTQVEGPSIRLAEAIAQAWGNIQSGVIEISNEEGKSEIMSFAWDLETNTRDIKVFQIKHERKAKGKVNPLEDPRDIYEHVANNAARRKRACILAVIPGDIVEAALDKCKLTLQTGNDPFTKRLENMVKAFEGFGIGPEILEDYLGHHLEATNEHELVRLRGVFRSIKDGMSKPEDHFNVEEVKPEQSPPAAESGPGPEPGEAPAAQTDRTPTGGAADPPARGRRGAKESPPSQPPAAGPASQAEKGADPSPASPSGGSPPTAGGSVPSQSGGGFLPPPDGPATSDQKERIRAFTARMTQETSTEYILFCKAAFGTAEDDYDQYSFAEAEQAIKWIMDRRAVAKAGR